MKSTKRVLALGMASVMTLGLLSACGNKPSSDNNNQASTLVVGDGNYDGKFSPFFYKNFSLICIFFFQTRLSPFSLY